MSKPKGKVKLIWSAKFAYAMGLIVSDGNLSKDGRHIIFTSKDLELSRHFLNALGIPESHIGLKARGGSSEKNYYTVQFSDVLFYRFLAEIGLMPNKSRQLDKIDIPNRYFSHFIRGIFDGDGTFYSYWDPRWKSSFMYYISFSSASPIFLRWFKHQILTLYDIRGVINPSKNKGVEQLTYAKQASKALAAVMYRRSKKLYLSRKYLKISFALAIVSTLNVKKARVEKLVNSSA